MTQHSPIIAVRTAKPHTSARDTIDILELETRLRDAQRAIRIADHFAIENDGQELTAYAVQQALAEIDAAVFAFYGRHPAA